jgi:hypothetical protein
MPSSSGETNGKMNSHWSLENKILLIRLNRFIIDVSPYLEETCLEKELLDLPRQPVNTKVESIRIFDAIPSERVLPTPTAKA